MHKPIACRFIQHALVQCPHEDIACCECILAFLEEHRAVLPGRVDGLPTSRKQLTERSTSYCKPMAPQTARPPALPTSRPPVPPSDHCMPCAGKDALTRYVIFEQFALPVMTKRIVRKKVTDRRVVGAPNSANLGPPLRISRSVLTLFPY